MIEILRNYNEKNDYPVVYGVFKGQKIDLDERVNNYLNELVESGFVSTELGNVTKVPTTIENKVIYLVGLGEEGNYGYGKLQVALRKVNYNLDKNLLIYLDSFKYNLNPKSVAKYAIDTICYYNYKYDELKTKKINNELSVKLYTVEDIDDVVVEAFNIAKAIDNTRDLVNKPYNYLNATDLAEYATELVKSFDSDKVNIKVYDKNEIEELKMGAFLGVNKGSTAEPKLIYITYQGKNEFTNPISLVGKGLMYDTGGYSLKQSMNNMKNDMAGSATVLGILEAAVTNKLDINLSVVICATDNRIDGGALLPDDVLTAMSGKTIEIVSTDAEGRLTLADAVYFAQKQGSKNIIDFATLTGAIVVALGDYTTGLFGNNLENINNLLAASKDEYEGLWHMPITEYMRERVRGSKVADLTNSTGRSAGAIGAAAFIEEFVEEGTKWMHLDIAGTAFNTSPAYNEFYGATGAMVKTVYNYLKKQD